MECVFLPPLSHTVYILHRRKPEKTKQRHWMICAEARFFYLGLPSSGILAACFVKCPGYGDLSENVSLLFNCSFIRCLAFLPRRLYNGQLDVLTLASSIRLGSVGSVNSVVLSQMRLSNSESTPVEQYTHATHP